MWVQQPTTPLLTNWNQSPTNLIQSELIPNLLLKEVGRWGIGLGGPLALNTGRDISSRLEKPARPQAGLSETPLTVTSGCRSGRCARPHHRRTAV
jgi:hypothetical protein